MFRYVCYVVILIPELFGATHQETSGGFLDVLSVVLLQGWPFLGVDHITHITEHIRLTVIMFSLKLIKHRKT